MLVPASINVAWTSQYSGPHRVCYRIVGAPSYTCTNLMTHPSCPGGGAPCSYNIAIMVDNETCDQIDYEGYVQPACQDESSLVDRIPFTISFIPQPACRRWNVTCNNAPINFLSLTGGGSGYDPLSPPLVTISGGGGGAASVIVGAGAYTSLQITDPGTGYTDGSYLGVPLIGGSGTGATADITIAGGIITIVGIAAQGTGYMNNDVVAPDTAIVGVPITPAILTMLTTDYGIVLSISLDNPGSGYTATPTVTIAPPGAGVQATATATLQSCPAFNTASCPGGTEYAYPQQAIGETLAICDTVTPSLGSQFAVAESGNCLCSCTTVEFQNTAGAGTVTVTYITCNGASVQTVLGAGASTGDVCIVNGSYDYVEAGGGTFNIIVGATCNGIP